MKATFVPVIPEGMDVPTDEQRHITCLIVDESAMLEIYMWSDGTTTPSQLTQSGSVERLRSSPLWQEL